MQPVPNSGQSETAMKDSTLTKHVRDAQVLPTDMVDSHDGYDLV